MTGAMRSRTISGTIVGGFIASDIPLRLVVVGYASLSAERLLRYYLMTDVN